MNHRHRKYGKSKYGILLRTVKGIYDIFRVLILIQAKKMNFINSLSNYELLFLIIGFIGQGIFASRFIVQMVSF